MTRCRLPNHLKRTESPEGPATVPQDVAIALRLERRGIFDAAAASSASPYSSPNRTNATN